MNTIKDLLHNLEENFQQYHHLLQIAFSDTSPQKGQNHQLEKFVATLKSIQDEVVDFRLDKILTEEHPYIPKITVTTAQNSFNDELQQITEAFLQRRAELLKMLKSLPLESWERTGVHEVEGHISFKELIRRMIKQDLQAIGRLSNEFALEGE